MPHFRKLIALSFLLVATGGTWFFWPTSDEARSPSSLPAPKVSASKSRSTAKPAGKSQPGRKVAGKAQPGRKVAAKAEQKKTTHPPREDIPQNPGHESADEGPLAVTAKEVVKPVLVNAFSVRDRVDTRTRRRQMFAELAGDRRAVEVMESILMDRDRALDLFGQKQAVARVMALKFFKHMADKGERRFIRDAIRAAKDRSTEEIFATEGNQKDFRSLTYYYFSSFDPRTVGDDLRDHLEALDFHALDPRLQRTVEEELYMFLSPHYLSQTPSLIDQAKS